MGARGTVIAVALVFLTDLPTYRPSHSPATDIVAYHFRISLADSSITAAATITFTTTADTLALDLVGMTVDSLDGGRPFRHDGRVLLIPLRPRTPDPGPLTPDPGPLTPDPGPLTPSRITIFYHGSPTDGLIMRRNARGRFSYFGDNWPERARFWLPTVDHPSDKARVTWDVTAPPGYRVVTTATGPAAIPTYCMVIGAAPMTVSAHRPAGGRVPIEVWTYPEDSAFADSVPFRRATEIVEVMERLVGPFSYQRLAHVQSSTRYGGMENSSAIFYAEGMYVRRRMGEGVVRHETAHQWFGDAVTERDWHHAWLSEGFASFFDAVIAQQLDGDSAYLRVLAGSRAGYLASRDTDRPLIDTTITDPNRMLNANAYNKGAWLLRMLRQEVGDSAFFGGVRAYYAAWRDSTVLSADFQRAMEAAAGRPLGWFFDQWLLLPGYPRLDVAWRYDAAARQVVLTVRQLQASPFRMPQVPLVLESAEGTRRLTFALESRTGEQVIRLAAPARPTGVVVDPDGTLLLTAAIRP